MKWDELQSKSFDIESGYEPLLDEIEVKLISLLYDNQEEACLDIEVTEEELNEEFEFEMRNKLDNVEKMKRNLANKIDPKQDDLLCRMFDE